MRRTSLPCALAAGLGAVVALAVASISPTSAQAPEVVVYTARHYGQEAAFEAFTRKTGIAVKLLAGQTGEMFERLKAEGERTPADVLVTVDAGNLWNASRAGLLARVAPHQGIRVRWIDATDPATVGIREYNRLAQADTAYLTTILPVRDGLSVSLRLK